MSVEHGGSHSGGGGGETPFFIEGVAKPMEAVWASIFDSISLFIVALLGVFNSITPASSQT